jgi:RNA polymerase sigma-70 factor (ECF subfamily)
MNPFDGQIPGFLGPDGSLALPDQSRPQAAEAELSAAVTALVEEYSGTLYRVAFSVLRNAAEAEDIVQETFLRVLRHRDRLPTIRDARVWLVRIAWNLVLDRKRRAKTRPENEDVADLANVLPARGLRADTALIGAQRHARVLELIDSLPRKEREVLLLTALEELSTQQIAAILSTTESTIRSRLFRARRDLSAMLRKEGMGR